MHYIIPKTLYKNSALKRVKVNIIILLVKTDDKYHKPAVLKVLLLQNI